MAGRLRLLGAKGSVCKVWGSLNSQLRPRFRVQALWSRACLVKGSGCRGALKTRSRVQGFQLAS